MIFSDIQYRYIFFKDIQNNKILIHILTKYLKINRKNKKEIDSVNKKLIRKG